MCETSYKIHMYSLLMRAIYQAWNSTAQGSLACLAPPWQCFFFLQAYLHVCIRIMYNDMYMYMYIAHVNILVFSSSERFTMKWTVMTWALVQPFWSHSAIPWYGIRRSGTSTRRTYSTWNRDREFYHSMVELSSRYIHVKCTCMSIHVHIHLFCICEVFWMTLCHWVYTHVHLYMHMCFSYENHTLYAVYYTYMYM